MITQDEQSSKLLRVRSPDYSCPGGRTGLRSAPLQRMTRLALAYSALDCLVGMRSRCGNLDAGRADVARQAFVDRAITCAGQRYCAAISVRSDSPNVDASLAGSKK